jgi:hypothetical protein
MPHIGQPGFGAKAILKNVSLRRHRRHRSVVVSVVVVVVVRELPSHVSAAPMTTVTISSTFEPFREHLDEHHDRRDRLIKVDRRLLTRHPLMHGPLLPWI